MKRIKWSEQSFNEQTLKVHENGKEVERKDKVLNVCISGMDMYRKSFIQSQHHQSLGSLSYDFIVLAGSECTKGMFYELEYMIGNVGIVYRALLQVVNPVTDIPIVLGSLDSHNLLPSGFTPLKAYITDYDAVLVGHCSRNQEDLEMIFSGGYYRPKEEEDGRSIKEYINGGIYNGACLEYYRGDVREIWAKKGDTFDPVFVCGSENVNDVCFSAKKEADMEELEELLNEAMVIMKDYNLPYFIMAGDSISCNVTQDYMENIVKAVYNSGNKKE